MSFALPRRRFLDVRHDGLPLPDSVRIPLGELEGHLHELPPKHEPVLIADTGVEAREAARRLEESGRRVELAAPPEHAPEDACPHHGRLWEPNPFLMECLPAIRMGLAADLACGGGREAVYMAGLGWHVTAIDQLESNLERGKDLANRYLPEEAARRIDWQVQTLSPEFDASVYDLVGVCFFLDRDVFSHIVETMRPGAYFLVETFTTLNRELTGRPSSDDHVLKPGELRNIAHPAEIVRYEEGWLRERHTARLLARR